MKENAIIIDGVKHTLATFPNPVNNPCSKCSLDEYCSVLPDEYPGICDMVNHNGSGAYFEILKQE